MVVSSGVVVDVVVLVVVVVLLVVVDFVVLGVVVDVVVSFAVIQDIERISRVKRYFTWTGRLSQDEAEKKMKNFHSKMTNIKFLQNGSITITEQ